MNNYFVWVEITANKERILNADLFADAMAKCASIERLLSHLPANYKIKAENIL